MYDSTTGNLTYRHYILAGGARVGVETLQANSGGTVTSDTLSFYVRDEVGSVMATVTENLGGANQTVALTSYGAWGKARPTSGSTAYQDMAPGSFYSPTPSGQEEGFAGHDNLDDTGLVDMEGRVYDPEVGTFLSPDPNVQYPFSSQGYERYSYVGDNPLSLSDPSGYFSLGGFLSTGDPLAGFFPQQYGQVLSVVGPIVGAALNAVPGCQAWCDIVVTSASEAQAGYLETGSMGYGLRAGVLAGAESLAFTYVAVPYGVNPVGSELVERSIADGLVGGAFSAAGGGRFGDGFIGGFVGSEASAAVGTVGGNANTVAHYSASNIATRAVLSAVVSGTVTRLTGGNFTAAATAAALQSVVNDEYAKQILEGRHLTADEIAGAKRVFGDKIDYSNVRVINGKFLFWQSGSDVMTPNGNIYWPGACGDLITCGSDTFIHEMTHVMQYQEGVDVEWQGMWLQIGRAFGINPYAIPNAYQPGVPYSAYNIEQQGQISIQIYIGKWPNIVNPGGG